MPGQEGMAFCPGMPARIYMMRRVTRARAGQRAQTKVCATRTLPPLSLTDMLCRKRQNARLNLGNPLEYHCLSHCIINKTAAFYPPYYN